MTGENADPSDTRSLPESLSGILAHDLAEDEYLFLDLKAHYPHRVLIPALTERIREAILGVFSPCCVKLRVGPHDVYEARRIGEGTYFGRVCLSVVFYDKQDPTNPTALGEQVFAVPEVIAFEQQMESFFGPINHVWYWGLEN